VFRWLLLWVTIMRSRFLRFMLLHVLLVTSTDDVRLLLHHEQELLSMSSGNRLILYMESIELCYKIAIYMVNFRALNDQTLGGFIHQIPEGCEHTIHCHKKPKTQKKWSVYFQQCKKLIFFIKEV
jgi:hypothetical protein